VKILKRYIPYGHQYIDKNDIESVIEILQSDFITQGPKIKEFEEALCGYTGAKYAVVVSSGTAALHIASLAAEIKNGDEVITSPITFVASANCCLYCGGKPIFADVQRDTINIDPFEIKKRITKRTKAVIPVHFGGHPCDLEEINRIARKHQITVIEDATHALGAEYRASKIGSCKYSNMTVFSFHPVKSITTGEGGAVLTNIKNLYEKLLLLRNHGITKDHRKFLNYYKLPVKVNTWYYQMLSLGFNYRMNDIQAALGISQLNKLDHFIEKRREIAEVYNESFKDNPYFDLPIERKYVYSAYHLYPIKLKNEFKNRREEVFYKLREKGLGVQVHYIPVYLQPYYKRLGFKKGLCPQAEDYYNKEISIPIHLALKESEIKYIIDSIFKVFAGLN
jgi:UDP-4-amino-4,6-dideoxy-N-acetyl-beta-L-altrosamine transaminase